jgi:hypothetical protein
VKNHNSSNCRFHFNFFKSGTIAIAEKPGFEPGAFGLTGQCSTVELFFRCARLRILASRFYRLRFVRKII